MVAGGVLFVALVATLVMAITRGEEGPAVEVLIPSGATLPDVAAMLESRNVIRSARLFQLYTRVRRADRKLKAGSYRLTAGSSMRSVLRKLTRGEVLTVALTIPEGFSIPQMAPRIAEVTGTRADAVVASLERVSLHTAYAVPGPSLEGYLFPDTYRFATGVPVENVIEAMVRRYAAFWTPARRALLETSGMSEREIVTLASIIQAEARRVEEMPRISGVYHNRLTAGWRLQADPTVLYALGGYRARLLYAAIDSVEDHPYNTYSHAGLPPGPIGSPGERAIEAALTPEEHDFMYFVAWPDGFHIFTRSLAEHNSAKQDAQSARQNTGS